MKKLFHVLLIGVLYISCKKEVRSIPRNISDVEIEHLIEDSLQNIRAIELANGRVWFGGANGYFGNQELFEYNGSYRKSNVWKGIAESIHSYDGFLAQQMKTDSTGYNIRAIAKIDDAFLSMTIESPAILVKYDSIRKFVYKENHPKAFYDAMEFWNDKEGIAIGDPTAYCMSIIITRDGGDTWTKLSCDDLPKVKEGEAAFAASDTNIAIVGDHTWVATGGKASRVLYSPDKGKTWEVFNTPIIQGKATTGMFSIAFYDTLNGFAIGGDYTKPDNNHTNKIRTVDGGKTWQVVAKNQNPGYRSCVQYIPGGKAKELVAIGFKGIDYSNDAGETWKHLSDEGFYTIRFLNDSVAYAAGAGRISRLTFKE